MPRIQAPFSDSVFKQVNRNAYKCGMKAGQFVRICTENAMSLGFSPKHLATLPEKKTIKPKKAPKK